MAQSAFNEPKLKDSAKKRSKSTLDKMAATKEELMQMDTEEIFDWDVDTLDAALKELNVTVGIGWSKSKKAHELNKEIGNMKVKDEEKSKVNSDPNMFMMQANPKKNQPTTNL